MKNFFSSDAAGGIVLFSATILALLVVHSPLQDTYHYILQEKHVAHWINDGLMAVFFLVVGFEIKQEMATGKLSNFKSAKVPFIAAIAGIAVPGLIFYLININAPENLRGVAIPTATDIAFSLGVLALIGSRAPASLKILLTAIAIIDDLAAIIIIAVFYTDDLNVIALGLALAFLCAMLLLNFLRISAISPYLIFGTCMWMALLSSGVHPTMAGVATAFCLPLTQKSETLIHRIHPFSIFFIVPVFAFANAGVSLTGMTMEDVLSPLTLGIIAGLVIGKTLGITAALGFFKPEGLKWAHIIGLGFLCGIGFTMSLFIGDLAFATDKQQNEIRLGVLIASLVSAMAAYGVLKFSSRER